MNCPKCANASTRVYGTRKGLSNVRFRVCERCNFKFMTKEVVKEDLFSKEYNDYLEDIGEIERSVRVRALRDE